ncbi:hypothetical protein GQ53DRAFT_121449 [Thozetella sp. PMI_491]|nr:hypothetical protein GQ53DRAFT_121449 [Thozetella sp. PMI_491]
MLIGSCQSLGQCYLLLDIERQTGLPTAVASSKALGSCDADLEILSSPSIQSFELEMALKREERMRAQTLLELQAVVKDLGKERQRVFSTECQLLVLDSELLDLKSSRDVLLSKLRDENQALTEDIEGLAGENQRLGRRYDEMCRYRSNREEKIRKLETRNRTLEDEVRLLRDSNRNLERCLKDHVDAFTRGHLSEAIREEESDLNEQKLNGIEMPGKEL